MNGRDMVVWYDESTGIFDVDVGQIAQEADDNLDDVVRISLTTRVSPRKDVLQGDKSMDRKSCTEHPHPEVASSMFRESSLLDDKSGREKLQAMGVSKELERQYAIEAELATARAAVREERLPRMPKYSRLPPGSPKHNGGRSWHTISASKCLVDNAHEHATYVKSGAVPMAISGASLPSFSVISTPVEDAMNILWGPVRVPKRKKGKKKKKSSKRKS